MSVRESLEQVLATLPESKLQQLLDYAAFLALSNELGGYQKAGKEQFAKGYGETEPEYTLADVRGNT
jgi:hypothetical protein